MKKKKLKRKKSRLKKSIRKLMSKLERAERKAHKIDIRIAQIEKKYCFTTVN